MVAVSYDASTERAAWERPLRLLVDEVLPACSSLMPVGSAT